ncbi:MAG TPA: class I SAM-dependent methyltransferase [Micromonosporaceae bacterium]|nr:class I SAM-dependent methyltransferase [Micromonosporaceae bacterium]
MAALLWHPPTHVPTEPPPDLHAATHRSRLALERILRDPHDESAWDQLAEYYDESAETWDDWTDTQPWYAAAVEAGLSHAKPADVVLEVSCGSGQATPLLDAFAPVVVATDTSLHMLDDAPRSLPHTTYASVDVRRLPLRSETVQLLVGLNAVPHIAEFTRVLARSGQLLWCTSFGAGTPLYVAPDRFVELLGAGWHGEAGRAGHGEWLLLTKD